MTCKNCRKPIEEGPTGWRHTNGVFSCSPKARLQMVGVNAYILQDRTVAEPWRDAIGRYR